MKGRILYVILAFVVWTSLMAFGVLQSTEPAEKVTTTKWVTQLQVGRFHVHSDFALAADEPLLGELSNISVEVSQLLAIPANDQCIHVVLFLNAKDYGRYIKNYFPTVPERRALYIQQRGPGMLFAHWHHDVNTDIRHEVVHGLLNDQARPLPLWLDEGLAEYFEVTADNRMYHNPHMAQVTAGIERDYVPLLADLERLVTIDQLGPEEYRDSWAWVHFLLHRKADLRKLLVQQLALHRSQQARIPLSRAIATTLPSWREEFREHFLTAATRGH